MGKVTKMKLLVLVVTYSLARLYICKPRGQAVRFTDEVKQYLTTRFDLGERTGNKADPGKVAADMRTSRKPNGSRMFERKDWLTKSQVQGFFSRLATTRRRQGNQEVQIEDVYAKQEEQERHGVLENVAAQLTTSFPGSLVLQPPGASEERPWLGLVTCLPESGR